MIKIIMITKYLQRIPYVDLYLQKRKQEQSQFYIQNRINVILSYRRLLKSIPMIYPRLLQQSQKLHELRYFFKSSKILSDRYETETRTKIAMKMVEQIQKGDYSRLGDFQPNYNVFSSADLKLDLGQKVPRPKKWWLSGYLF